MLKIKNDFFELLDDLKKYDIKPGLIRIKKVLAALDNPQHKFKYIHIAGTNGKGSTALFAAAFLRAIYKKVGLFISPEIFEYNDRISINGTPISDKELINHSNKIISAIKTTKVFLTEFEFCTVLMFDYFAAQKLDFAVIETGMGGRLDSTNAGKPVASIITSIDYDHIQFLGGTLEKICAEKSEILRYADNRIIGKMQIEKYKLIKKYILENMSANKNTEYYSKDFKVFTLKKKVFFINNGGKIDISEINKFPEYQKYNCASALQAVYKIMGQQIFKIDFNKIIAGIILPFRFQKISDNPVIIIDASHNIEAIKYFIKTASKINKLQICIYSGFKDKNYAAIIKLLSANFKKLYLFNLEHPRAAALKKFADNKRIYFFENYKQIILKINTEKKYAYMITGSYVTARLFRQAF